MSKTNDKLFLKAGITGKLQKDEIKERHYFDKTENYTLAGSTYSISYIVGSSEIELKDMIKNTQQLSDKMRPTVMNIIADFKSDYKEDILVSYILNSEVHPEDSDGILVKFKNAEYCLNPKYLKALKYMEDIVSVEYCKNDSQFARSLKFRSPGKQFIIMPIRLH